MGPMIVRCSTQTSGMTMLWCTSTGITFLASTDSLFMVRGPACTMFRKGVLTATRWPGMRVGATSTLHSRELTRSPLGVVRTPTTDEDRREHLHESLWIWRALELRSG